MKFFITEKKPLAFVDLDLVLKAGLPIGTVHEWNGQRFKKYGEGDWRPVSTGAESSKESKKDKKSPKKKIDFEEKIKKIELVISSKIICRVCSSKSSGSFPSGMSITFAKMLLALALIIVLFVAFLPASSPSSIINILFEYL